MHEEALQHYYWEVVVFIEEGWENGDAEKNR
jgi:hypothetical protein